MKIGYILTTYPCLTETFAAREIEDLRILGFDITVLAATGHHVAHRSAESVKIVYRPPLFSMCALLSIGYMSIRYPLALVKLVWLILKLIRFCPREAISLMRNLHTVGFFTRHLDREAISHVHAYFLNWPACIGVALATITGCSLSIAAHARDIFVEHGATKLKVSRAKFIRTCTQQGLSRLKANLSTNYHHKCHLNYHGVETDYRWLDPSEHNIYEGKSDSTVIAVGRLTQKKGFASLLKAFALVVQERPLCKLMIVGNGPEQKQLNELVKQLGIEDSVQLLGQQCPDVTLQLIKQATVLVAPSVIANDGDRDGIPNVILEAFASGVPVIASDLEGIREVVRHQQTGLLVDPDDVRGLALAINELLNNKDLQKRLSQKAYKIVTQHFNSVTNTRQLAELFLRTSLCAAKQ